MPSAADDKDAIRDLFAEYCFCLDGGRFADMAALFAETGVWDTAFGRAEGRAQIERLVAALASRRAERPRMIHSVANIVIRLDGDRASAFSNWVLVRNGEAGPVVDCAGSYTDAFTREAAGWRFSLRKIDRFIAADVNPAPIKL